ncbi:MAG: DUF3280 domain-containing protein [Geminicoccaceae bacterium]
MARLLLVAAVLHQALVAAPAGASDPARLAVFAFELVDTSLQGEVAGVDPAEAARLEMIEAELRERLAASGRFELVDDALAADPDRYLWSCNGCEVALADRLGADLALVGWVQKVSNLILNINVTIRAVPSRERVFAASVDIRGNTDESWRRGIRYLLENRLLGEPGR